MRIIPTKVHGMLDYLYGIAFIIAPFFFTGEMFAFEEILAVIVGAAVIIISVCTNYEWGAFKIFSMRTHLTIDLIVGIFLLVSPWLFGFPDEAKWAYIIFGLIAIVASLISQTKPSKQGKLGPATL